MNDEILRRYLDAHEVFHDAKERLDAAKRAFDDLEPDSIGLEAAHWLYWFTPVPAETIGWLLGIGRAQGTKVAPMVGPGPPVACPRCGDAHRPKSRTAITSKHQCGRCDAELARETAAYLDWVHDDHRLREQRLAELRTMPYRDYLQTPEWDATRRAALKRARFRCQMCAAVGVVLDVHHNTYENRGAELVRDLIVLCRECHAHHHHKIPAP